MSTSIPPTNWGVWKWENFRIYYNSNVETNVGFTLPKNGEIDHRSMMVYVQTAESAKTLNVGLLYSENSNGGDADGFLAAVSLTSAGWVRPAMTATAGNTQYYISANTYGVYFFTGLAGGNAAGTASVPILRNFIGDGSQKTMSYTVSSGAASFVGFLVFRWRQLPDLTNFSTLSMNHV